MRYVLARAKQENEIKTYRIYVTDALQIVSENTAMAILKGGRYMAQRYADIIYSDRTEQEEDTRTCKEIVTDMWRNLRGEEVEHG